MKKTIEKVLSMLIVLTLVIGLMAPAASAMGAGTGETKTIHYVSLGDSMSNGYCFNGYGQSSSSGFDVKNQTNVYGEGAYPLQFEQYLKDQGYVVDHTKLALSATLACDLWYLLGGREMADDGWGGLLDYAGASNVDKTKEPKCATEELKNYYRNAVTEADIITLCLGNAEFGAYLLNRITDALGILGAQLEEDEKVTLQDALDYSGLDAEQRELVQQVYDVLVEELKGYIPEALWAQYNVQEVCNLLAYTTAGYVFNYKGCLETMVTMNPDVEIILIGLMNTTYGMTVTMDDGSCIPVGDIMDGVFELLNAYVAGLPTVMQIAGQWEEATFYYAEQPNPLFICQAFEGLYDNNWNGVDDRLSGQIVRERNIKAYNNSLRGQIAKAFQTSLPEISLDEVKNFEKNNPSFITDNETDSKNLSIAIYLGVEEAVARSCGTMDIPASSLIKIVTDISSAFDGLNLASSMSTPASVKNALAAYLTSTKELKGMCMIYALFCVGDGMSVHPTPAGHDKIAASVIEAYASKHTAQDETVDNAIAALQTAAALIAEYYDEAYAYGYQYALQEGYIAQAVAAIDEVIAAVNAMDLSGVEMTEEFRTELEAELTAVVATLEQAKLAVQNVPTVDALLAAAQQMNDELCKHLAAIKTLGTQAGVDLTELAIIPAVEMAVEIVETKLIPAAQVIIEQANANLSQKLGQAYDQVVEQVRQILSKYVPEAEAWVEKWLDKNVEIKTQLEELKAQLDTLRAELEQAIRDGQQQLAAQIQKQIDMVIEEAERLVREFVGSIFSAEYVTREDSLYVAITGNTNAYAAAVAGALGLDYSTMDWSNIDIAALASADLISIGFDEQQIYGFAAEQVLGYIANFADVDLRNSIKTYLKTALTDGTGNMLSSDAVTKYVGMVDTYLDALLANDLFAGKAVQTMEWTSFLGENAAYVDQARTALYNAMAENEIPETYTLQINLIDYLAQMDAFKDVNWETVRNNLGDKAIYTIELPAAEFVDLFVESFLYGMIRFHVEYATTIETITKINPEAVVLVLNYANPFRGLTLTVGNYTVELGQFYEVAAQIVSVHPFLQAVTKTNVVYVDVQDTQTVFGQLVEVGAVENTLQNLALTVLEYGNVLVASENGNAYIAQQILDVLNVVCGHWDNNDDHYCDNCGNKISECVDSNGDYKCDICGKSMGTPVVPPAPVIPTPTPTDPCEKGHSWNEGEVTTEASCTAEGVKTFTCSVCGTTKTETIAKMAHNWVEATCTEPKTCSVCKTTEGDAKGHSWTDATCTEPKTCSVCKATEGDAKGHSWTDATCTEPKTCSACKATEGNAKGHSWTDATCTEPKTCSVCKMTEGNAKGHSWTDATCTDPKTCSVCKATEGTALGHKYANACDADCDVCGAKRTPAEHVYGEWSVVTEATRKIEGKQERRCSICGNVETEVIPVLEQSGLSTGAIVAVVATVVILGGGTGAFFFLKKKKF